MFTTYLTSDKKKVFESRKASARPPINNLLSTQTNLSKMFNKNKSFNRLEEAPDKPSQDFNIFKEKCGATPDKIEEGKDDIFSLKDLNDDLFNFGTEKPNKAKKSELLGNETTGDEYRNIDTNCYSPVRDRNK